MIGNDPHGNVCFYVLAIRMPRYVLEALENGGKKVRVIVADFSLHNRCDPLESHTRID